MEEPPHEQPSLHISLTRNPERDNLPPELLADYEPVGEELLGEGAFAVVRLMRHCKSGELFALKCLEKHPLRIRNMIEQMHREVRIQQNLSHLNILRLVRVYDDSFYVYMLLEYCSKGPLRSLIQQFPDRRLEEPLAASYFEQIVAGVAWMHRNQCVHRDLKLENMLLTDNDVVKICDFGWSAEMEIEKMLKTTCGTTAYWAPEIWENAVQDEAVDMWALGCMLYEMLAGHAPFHEQDQNKLKQKVLSVEFGYPPWFSNEACHMVHILLQSKPANRVKSCDLLNHPWLSKYKDKSNEVGVLVGSAVPNVAAAEQSDMPPPLMAATPSYPDNRAYIGTTGRGRGSGQSLTTTAAAGQIGASLTTTAAAGAQANYACHAQANYAGRFASPARNPGRSPSPMRTASPARQRAASPNRFGFDLKEQPVWGSATHSIGSAAYNGARNDRPTGPTMLDLQRDAAAVRDLGRSRPRPEPRRSPTASHGGQTPSMSSVPQWRGVPPGGPVQVPVGTPMSRLRSTLPTARAPPSGVSMGPYGLAHSVSGRVAAPGGFPIALAQPLFLQMHMFGASPRAGIAS